MLAAGITKDFGVLATDSALYSTEDGKTSFESMKLSLWKGRYFVAFIGTNLYFSRIDTEKFLLPMNSLALYLQDILKKSKPDIEVLMKENIKDEDENKPYFCLYVLGLYGKKPTLASFNSFNDFVPKYLWEEKEGVRFSNLIYGDDSIPEKSQIFKETTNFMQKKAQEWPMASLSPGLTAEILTRGIYYKADLEMKIGLKKKYAGGIVNAAGIKSDGTFFSLSGVEVINGGR